MSCFYVLSCGADASDKVASLNTRCLDCLTSAWVFLLSTWQVTRCYLGNHTTPVEMLYDQTNQTVGAAN